MLKVSAFYLEKHKSFFLKHFLRPLLISTKKPCLLTQFSVKVLSAGLRKHVMSVHEKLKPYKCEICDKSFAAVGNLNSHVSLVHEKSAQVQCTLCGKTYTNQKVLEKHIEEVHLKIRKYQCDQCPSTFIGDLLLLCHKKGFARIFCIQTQKTVKFIYSEKAIKFCEISTVDLNVTTYFTVPLGDWLERKKSYSYNHKTTIWVSHEYYLNPEFHKILSRAF